MQIEFRECDWFSLWLWFEFVNPPAEAEKQYLEQVLESWYTLGMLGGFNATALAAQEAGVDLSYMDYPPATEQMPSLMHNMGAVDYQADWGRCWFDLGTADVMSLDILLGALSTLSQEYIGLKRVIVGGKNPDWPLPDMEAEGFEEYGSDNHFDLGDED